MGQGERPVVGRKQGALASPASPSGPQSFGRACRSVELDRLITAGHRIGVHGLLFRYD